MRIVFQRQRGAVFADGLFSLAHHLRLCRAREVRINAVPIPVQIETDERQQQNAIDNGRDKAKFDRP